MPGDTRNKASKTLRKEMTSDEYKKLKDSKVSPEERAEMSKGIIKRAKERPENKELKEELKPYLDKISGQEKNKYPKK